MFSTSIQALLQQHGRQLQTALQLDPASARIEAQCLLQAVLQVNRAYLLSHPEQLLNDQQYADFVALFERRMLGEPVAYLLGSREFYGLVFKVTPDTLIPRPDTELLVELALQHIPSPSSQGFRVLDMGTGSGAIALAIAHVRPDVQVVAVDASEAALEVARFNARQHKLDNVRLLLSDWFSELHDELFDIIVSNPPYIAAGDAHLSQGDVRFEPPSALASGTDGLEDIRRILVEARDHLHAGGWLLFEHGYDQAGRVRDMLLQAGFTEVLSARDLGGIERVSGGRA